MASFVSAARCTGPMENWNGVWRRTGALKGGHAVERHDFPAFQIAMEIGWVLLPGTHFRIRQRGYSLRATNYHMLWCAFSRILPASLGRRALAPSIRRGRRRS